MSGLNASSRRARHPPIERAHRAGSEGSEPPSLRGPIDETDRQQSAGQLFGYRQGREVTGLEGHDLPDGPVPDHPILERRRKDPVDPRANVGLGHRAETLVRELEVRDERLRRLLLSEPRQRGRDGTGLRVVKCDLAPDLVAAPLGVYRLAEGEGRLAGDTQDGGHDCQ